MIDDKTFMDSILKQIVVQKGKPQLLNKLLERAKEFGLVPANITDQDALNIGALIVLATRMNINFELKIEELSTEGKE